MTTEPSNLEPQGSILDNLDSLTAVTPTTSEGTVKKELLYLGTKYSTVEELDNAYHHANSFIEQLKLENELLKKDVSKVDSVLEALKQKNTSSVTIEQPTISGAEKPAVQAVEVNMEDEIAKYMQKQAAQDQAKKNVAKTDELLISTYGTREAAAQAIKSVTDKGDHLKETVIKLSNSDPEAMIAFVKSLAQPNTIVMNTPGTSTGQSPSTYTSGNHSFGITWTEAKEIMAKDRKKYDSPDFQAKLAQAADKAKASGVDFFNQT